jgi:glycerol-3-phosphate dehydrogenase
MDSAVSRVANRSGVAYPWNLPCGKLSIFVLYPLYLFQPNLTSDIDYTDIKPEICYAALYEYMQTAIDFITHCCCLAFLNALSACEALPCLVNIIAQNLGWSCKRNNEELQQGVTFLMSMGLRDVPEVVYVKFMWGE